MQPTELNLLLAVVTNYLYTSLAEKDFSNLAIFLSILSKEMLRMEAIRELVKVEEAAEEEEETLKPPGAPIPPPGPGPGRL